jgi:uncharacterized protein YdaU (DUF1376 family)
MKRPWMPLYVGDYLAKTGHLTTEQHGAYFLLILHYWANEGLPTQPEALMAIARMTPEKWAGNCLAIAKFFDSQWRHSRLDEEIEKAKTVSQKRAYAGLKGAWSKHGGPVANAWQMPPHSHSHKERKNGR